ncbi:hypothetical protein CCP1ISM_50011 [Azospirillaceae bacterium]
MSLPLGSPTQATPLTITDVAQAFTLPHGIISLEFQNTGSNDCYFGDKNVISTNGGVIYSNGDRKTFETLPSNWTVYLICATGKTTTLRIIKYL